MIKPKKMELGLGIHGEPGMVVEDIASVSKIVKLLMDNISAGKRMAEEAKAGYACLINNLGSVPPQEMSVITKAVMTSPMGPKIKYLVGPALLCTSLDMNG